MIKKIGIIISIIIVLAGCKSQFISEPYELKDILIEDVGKLLGQEKYIQAVQYIDYLEREQNLNLDEYKGQVRQKLIDLFHDSIAQEDFYRAFKYYVSITAAFNDADLNPWNLKELYKSLAEKSEQPEIQLIYFLTALQEDPQDIELAEIVINKAIEMGNYAVAVKILGSFPQDQLLTIREKMKSIDPVTKTNLMMRGTATVWVDRGIKIEQGMGLPDIILGSAFFIDPRGYLITNYHVIQSEVDPTYEGYSKLSLKLPNDLNDKIPAKVVGWDKLFDLALLKVEIEPEYFFKLSYDLQLEPGEKIYVIGSPLDPVLENTITSGIVSASGRRGFLQLGDVIQIDAPVNPGNSGGPMLNENKELGGVIFAGIQPYEGLNFAIPVNWLAKVLPRLFKEGKVEHPWLGLALNKSEYGIKVIYTVPGTAGQKAGIKQGDILLKINGKPATSLRDFQNILLDYPTGALVNLTWKRDGHEIEGLVALEKRPELPFKIAFEKDAWDNVLYPLYGFKLKKIGKHDWSKEFVVQDVLVGSVADNSGISVNDPILIRDMKIDDENKLVTIEMIVEKRTEGYLQSYIFLPAWLESDIFL